MKTKIYFKKYIITFTITFLSFLNVKSQCWENINSKTTHWNKSDIVNGVEQNKNYNDFDWTAQTYSKFYLAYLPSGFTNPVTLTLPMWDATGSSLSTQDNTYHFTKIVSSDEKDFHPNDGWELLNKDFGQAGAANNTTSNPFFALYNRYTGKIRIFFLTPEKLNNVSSAVINMDFLRVDGNKITGMFQNIKPISKVLLELDNSLKFNTTNFTNAGVYFYWYTADFVVTYDPCTCNSFENLSSDLTFSLIKIEEAEITLEINGTSKELVKNAVKKGDQNISHSFSDLKDIDNLKKLLKDGQSAYKSWDAKRNSFTQWLDKLPQVQKTEVDKSINQYRDFLYANDANDPISLLSNPSTSDLTFEIGNNTKNYKKYMGMKFQSSDIEDLKNIASVVPYIGTAISIYKYFNGGGNSTDKNENAVSPVTYTQNLTARGKIKSEIQFSSATFSVPGTENKNTSAYVPHYNNILGVFNIIQIPKLEYLQYEPKFSPNWSTCKNENLHIDERNIVEYNNTLNQYRLSSDLKYVLNPASNLKIFSIDAAYVIEYNSNYNTFGVQNGHYYPITDFTHLSDDCVSYPVSQDIYNHNFKDLTYLKNTEFFIENIYEDSLVILRTKYVPINSLKYHSFILEDNTSNNTKPKISIKLMIKLERLDDPNAEKVTLIHSYDFANAIENAQKINMGNLNYEKKLLYEKNNISDNSYTVSGQEVVGKLESYWPSLKYSVDVLTIPPNTTISTDIYAKKKIIISDNVKINSGITLTAGEEIIINPNNEFYPNVNFNIGKNEFPGWTDNPILLHNTNTEISNLCNDKIYKDKVKLLKREEHTNPSTFVDNIMLSLYPNPAKHHLNLTAFFPYAFGQGKIELLDATGKLVMQTQISSKNSGTAELEINVKDFSNGFYFLQLSTEKEKIVRKLIISN